jgi:hypothetical protein
VALIDNVQLEARDLRASAGSLALPGVDWGLIAALGMEAVKEALRREVWAWIDANPDAVVFRVNVNTKVWFVPIKIRWAVKARDAEPFVKFILGERPPDR